MGAKEVVVSQAGVVQAGLAVAQYQEELFVRFAPLDTTDGKYRLQLEDQMGGALAIHRALTAAYAAQRHLRV